MRYEIIRLREDMRYESIRWREDMRYYYNKYYDKKRVGAAGTVKRKNVSIFRRTPEPIHVIRLRVRGGEDALRAVEGVG